MSNRNDSLNTLAAGAGLLTAFFVNLGGSAIGRAHMHADSSSFVGDAILGAVDQGLFNIGLVAGITVVTCCCLLPCTDSLCPSTDPNDYGARTSFAAGYYPLALVSTFASLGINMAIQNDNSLATALNMLAPLAILAMAACCIGATVGCKNLKENCQQREYDVENGGAHYVRVRG